MSHFKIATAVLVATLLVMPAIANAGKYGGGFGGGSRNFGGSGSMYKVRPMPTPAPSKPAPAPAAKPVETAKPIPPAKPVETARRSYTPTQPTTIVNNNGGSNWMMWLGLGYLWGNSGNSAPAQAAAPAEAPRATEAECVPTAEKPCPQPESAK